MRRIAIAVALILMLATAAYAGEIFQYTNSDGTVSFTDDVKKIPPAYKDVAERVVLEGEFKDFDRLTVLSPDERLDLFQLEDTENPVSVFNEPCTGIITVTSERRQFGDFNRTVYSVHDECGSLVSETFSQPEVDIER